MGNFVSSLSTTAEQALRGRSLKGKTVLITGGSSGIGLETSRVLAMGGAKVYSASHHLEDAKEAFDGLEEKYGRSFDITPLELDLSSFRSIRAFVEQFKATLGSENLDVLILNAAVMQTPPWKTREGFEYQLGVNYLGHVELTTLLIEGIMLHKAMEEHLESRVLVVSCRSPLENAETLNYKDLNFNIRPYGAGSAYAQSKIALALWATDLASRLQGVKEIGVFLVCPGVSITKLNRFLPVFSVIYDMAVAPFVKTNSQAASTSIHCATADRLIISSNGGWFENCKRCKPPTILNNDKLAEKLREVTKQMIEHAAIDSHEPIDYNPGKLMMKRVQELFLGPLQQRFAWLLGSGHNYQKTD